MGDVDRLLAAFEADALCRPDASQPNVIDLVRAVGALSGVPDLDLSPNAKTIGSQIGQPSHIVFVLVDGLGTHAFDDLPRHSWLRRQFAGDLQSVFPSTTAAAITSMATGLWPAEHGAVGWWTYLPQLRETACVLPFIRLGDGAALLDCGVDPTEVFRGTPLIGRMTADAAVSQPRAIINSAYSTWFGAGAATLAYRTHAQAANLIAERVGGASRPTFTYWYTSAFDHESHEHGAESDEARDALADIDESLAELATTLSGLNARIVLTADHGHRDAGARFPIAGDDPLIDFLTTPPSGDMRLGFYHLREGAHDAFIRAFEARFGDHFALISTQDLEDLRLLGPDPLADETRRRVGDLTSLALDDSVMRYTGGADGEHFMEQRSHHSGLSHREMTVPLVIG